MKNEKKWIVIAIVLLVMAIAVRITGNMASAKEAKEDLDVRAEVVTVWQSNDNWGDSMMKIMEAFQDEYEDVKLVDTRWNTDYERMELAFMTEYGVVTGHIYR